MGNCICDKCGKIMPEDRTHFYDKGGLADIHLCDECNNQLTKEEENELYGEVTNNGIRNKI